MEIESVVRFSKRCREDSFKSTRKIFIGNFLWLVFNISLVIFDWETFINSPSHVTAVSFGAMLVTTVWSFFWMLQTWDEVKTEKHHLKFLTELEATQMASAELRGYANAKNEYEQLIERLQKHTEGTQNDQSLILNP